MRNRSRRNRYHVEPLEPRRLLAVNIHLTDAYLADDSGNAIANPVVGTYAQIRTDFTTDGLASNASYTISSTLDGVVYTYNLNWGAGLAGTGFWEFLSGDRVILRGPGSGSLTLDSNNTVAESNESDNSASFTFTPTQLQLQTKLQQPLGAVAERNYGYVNYTDQDSTSPGYVDYRGGPYTYDGHDAIDMTFPNFTSMDSGVPVVAAEGGTVVDLQDGNFDRNTSGMPDANYIVIDSGNGYQQYYYHLRNGSVGVHLGQNVSAGQVIGLVGSSGNSTGTHLHFAVYNGSAVETYQDPNLYWQNPVPYQGEVDQVEDSGVTNVDPTPALNVEERPTEYRNFKQQSNQLAWAWFTCFTATNEPGSINFYRPGGALYGQYNFTTSGANRGGYYYADYYLPATPDLGTWQTAFVINGVELARNSFQVTAAGSATALVSQGSTYLSNNRTTPIDGGTYTVGAATTPLIFTVKNTGDATLTLGGVSAPAGWAIGATLPASLAAGASATFSAFPISSVTGYEYGFIRFATGDPTAPSYSFAVQSEIDPTGTTPAVSLYTRAGTASETGRQPGIVRVTRTGSTTNPLTVNLIIGGSAVNGTDYDSVANTVTIPAGQSSASVDITPVDDTSAELTETATFALNTSSGYTIAPGSSATINLLDNDTAGTSSITGQIYLDKNFNTYQDSGETGVSGVGLFLDINGNGVLDSGEPQTTTDGSGNYTFSSLAAGRYNTRPTSGGSYVISTPLGSYNVAAGQALSVNLGTFPIVYTGTAGNDTFSIAPGSTSNRMSITDDGVTVNALRSQLPSLTFNGLGGNDTLTIDATRLSLPPGLLSAVPINFNGSTGVDAVILTNTDATTDVNAQAAQLTVSASTITLSGVESTVLDGAAGATVPVKSLTIGVAAVAVSAGKTCWSRPTARRSASAGCWISPTIRWSSTPATSLRSQPCSKPA